MSTPHCACNPDTAGACAGVQALTPQPVANRPGLDALRYRVGTHGAFLETMKARLATMTVDVANPDGQGVTTLRPLTGLTTRDPADPAIALLDGWATLADVLTFYQERLANEGYLRTATERRSVLELARLIGYTPRPGVAASAFLAYTLDEDRSATPPKPSAVTIPKGSRAQSVPAPGELPQTFETSDDLEARSTWNQLPVRQTQPQRIGFSGDQLDTRAVYFAGTATNLKPGDALLFDFDSAQVLCHVATVEAQLAEARTKVTLRESPHLARMQQIKDHAEVIVTATPTTAGASNVLGAGMIKALSRPPSQPPASRFALSRDAAKSLAVNRDALPQLLGALRPALRPLLYPAWASATVTPTQAVTVYALRLKSAPFGNNAPLKPVLNDQGVVVGHEEWPLTGAVVAAVQFDNRKLAATVTITRQGQMRSAVVTPGDQEQTISLGTDHVKISTNFYGGEIPTPESYQFEFVELAHTVVIKPLDGTQQSVTVDAGGEQTVSTGKTVAYATAPGEVTLDLTRSGAALSVELEALLPPSPLNVVDLEAPTSQVQPDGWAVVLRADTAAQIITRVRTVQDLTRADYGLTGKSTRLTLETNWLSIADVWLSVMRGATVLAGSEALPLAEVPFHADRSGNPADVKGATIELAQLCDGLAAGRWIIVSGERTDIANTTGLQASELAMIAGVRQTADVHLPGDKVHSELALAQPLAFTYKRTSVVLWGNVVKATHGETRQEVLGNGDAAQPLQTFVLKQPPLTFVAAATPTGAASTLQVFVNDVAWHEADTLAGRTSRDRVFITKTSDDAKTSVVFGNGRQGARLPTGVENVRAVYRNGIGQAGNVKAGQLTLLQTKPLGVKSVVNPLRASGGADAESRDQARENAPLAVMALDRLVSVQDYADFTRTFAGIGKAVARRLSDGHRQLVHVTIAGADDIPIDPTSDLYLNLLAALRAFGDPALPVRVDARELLVLVLSAKVRLAADYQWEPVATALRGALVDTFGFARRALGQPVFLSEIVQVMQHTEGVAWVDVDAFGGIPEMKAEPRGQRRLLTLNELAQAARQIVTPGAFRKPVTAQPAQWVPVNQAGLENGVVRPAQLAIFVPSVPDMLTLNQIK